jgi:glycosyltransferase involved in cell wall biosynthesis
MTNASASERRPGRVAIFTDTASPELNGAAITIGRLAGHLKQRGWRVAMIAPSPIEPPTTGLDLAIELPCTSVPFIPESRAAWGPRRRDLAALTAFNPDVVHVATEFAVGWSGRRFARGHGVPLITSSHSDFPAFFESWGLGFLEPLTWTWMRACHGDALLTLCPSRSYIQRLRAHGFQGDLRLWPRGVDAERFNPAHRAVATRGELAPGADCILVFVGRIAPEKRVDLLVEAFEKIKRATKRTVNLVVVGTGPSLSRLRARAPAGVSFTGYLEGAELSRAYAAADIFLFPSDTETFGNVVLEAMASGLPPIVADRGGVMEVVTHDTNGLIARSGSAKSFAAQALQLLHDEPRRQRLAKQARQDALARRWTPLLDGVLEYYEQARDSAIATQRGIATSKAPFSSPKKST